ncbi:MAG: aminotransferase class I/II-fold pyridoxal phosphate-dependent enzyme [Alphaproteobacteria bacterium]|jgi:alanine-synthesizing transaminase|nr:aminotransferase class I/II-fold pyridoxal phosphate-dependent enzyme [Alphaproteobacteria bacterium]MBT5828216.1 aminotransferase class I/II-fold pyridoxal phosphate-dependent enzyme [Alphaproteobacteria bacterium]
MKTDFYRIQKLPSYVFAEVNKLKDSYRSKGFDIIDFGMGNPMYKPPNKVLDKLRSTSQKNDLHGYSVSRGIKGLRKAQSNYYKKRFSVELDPESEVIVSIGSKEGLSSLALAISGPNDTIVVPDPSYPIHSWGFTIAGAKVKKMPHPSPQKFFINFKKYVEKVKKKPLAVIVNYPCNPTAQTVDLDFYAEFVQFCKYHNIYIISDLAYSEIYFNDTPPPSILQIEGAKDIAIEFSSLSKTYSMAGWRIGFAVGNKTLISAITKIKSYLDYGIFTPLQIAATIAINECDEYPAMMRDIYKERRDIFVNIVKEAGWDVTIPDASMFIWTKLPKKFKSLSSLEFSKLLLEKANVAVSPGNGFGAHGEGYVRISLVENKNRIRQGAKNIKKLLLES